MSERAHTLAKLTAAEFLEHIKTIDHIPTLEAYLEAERQSQNRDAVTTALEIRIANLDDKIIARFYREDV